MKRLARGTQGALAITLAITAASASPAAAESSCDEAAAVVRTDQIADILDHDALRAERSRLAWGTFFTLAAAVELGGAAADYAPFQTETHSVRAAEIVSGTKAAIASFSQVILPLRIDRIEHATPGTATSACHELVSAENSLRIAAHRERNSFYLNHIGGMALAVAGMLVLGIGEHAWGQAGLSVAEGYPIGLASTYSLPRGAWHAWRDGIPSATTAKIKQSIFDRSWIAGPVVLPGYAGLGLSAQF